MEISGAGRDLPKRRDLKFLKVELVNSELHTLTAYQLQNQGFLEH